MKGARTLAELTAGLLHPAPADLPISDVTIDSRAVSAGSLFLACRGRTHHGIEFAEQAAARGAAAVLYEPAGLPSSGVPELRSQIFVAPVPELSQHVGTIADRFFGSPSAALAVTAVTGTNGKTTCAYLLAQALSLAGKPAAYIGTLGYGRPGAIATTNYTTADAVTVHRQLDELRRMGAVCVAMEVSSHALDQARVSAVRFQTAAFTNLTRDHLDYHGTMEAYAAAKARLFDWPTLDTRVVNIDDEFGLELARRDARSRLIATTRHAERLDALRATGRSFEFIRAREVRPEAPGLAIGIDSSWGARDLHVQLIGDFNADNVLTVCGMLLASKLSLAEAARALEQCSA
ncbi:MAG TPA: UDP-N-acetylmuramyl-tripeptide synthetase, partial [Steroidobacteraceae bacterium]